DVLLTHMNPGCRIGTITSTDEPLPEIVEITQITPNPSEDNFNLLVHSREYKTVEVLVSDVNGQTVQTGKVNTNEMFVFGAEYDAGVYVVKIIKDDKMETFKVVKIK
ncbi:MAG TPA: T9SS type A sorting domain-containing protein, partial [Cytophagaceae bacterium]|nr:T9SS type A sorting domain-containing protein [Cytophagaceae bacterium]